MTKQTESSLSLPKPLPRVAREAGHLALALFLSHSLHITPPSIESVLVSTTAPAVNDLLEIHATTSPVQANPDNPGELDVWTEITTLSSRPVTVPAFWCESFRADDALGKIVSASPAEWRVRYTPRESGPHHLVLHAHNAISV